MLINLISGVECGKNQETRVGRSFAAGGSSTTVHFEKKLKIKPIATKT